MSIEVNTEKVKWIEGETVSELLQRMNFVYPMLVIRMNGTVIPRPRYPETEIEDGAVLEILHLESGG